MSTSESPSPEKPKRTLLLTTLLTSGAILLCRFSGLLREIVFTSLFGASAALDAFYTAFRIPNLLRDLLAEGALSQSYTSVLAKRKQAEGENSAWTLARRMGTQIFLLMIVIVSVGIFFAEPVMAYMFDKRPECVEFATRLNQIMWPFIGFISFAALVMGTLNIIGSFALPMLASAAFNIITIVVGFAVGWFIDPHFGPKALIGFAIAVTLGGAAQWLVQWPPLHKAGFRFHFDFNWKDKGITTIWSLMIPAVLASGVTQINVFINTGFALQLVDGSVTALSTAFRLWQLPVGLFGVATGMVVLPDIARLAGQGNKEEIVGKLIKAFRQIAFFALPSFIVLFFLSEEVVSLMYQRGKFGPEAVVLTGSVLQTYALGLLGYAGIKVAQPVFIALEKKWVPLNIALVAFGINYGMNYTFVKIWHKDCSWLALTTSVVMILNFLAYYFLLTKVLGNMQTSRLLSGISKSLIAAVVMGALCWLGKSWFLDGFLQWNFFFRLIGLGLVAGVSGAVYLGAAYLTKAPEMTALVNKVKGKLGKRS